MASSTTKAAAERHQRILLELLKQPGNEVCADCKTRNPRWASWNLGIFICVKCAGIHRKLGTHITKVKSLTLDSWTKEQVQCMKHWETLNQIRYTSRMAQEIRHPPIWKSRSATANSKNTFEPSMSLSDSWTPTENMTAIAVGATQSRAR
ncbi:hypothetical protein H4Q26_003661 [Puccinia striiformis f. sp. tritici PST-130]|nr:hypothetical protein H4Q26_003661 [Puccinia striiformis f. sp. tritici PST-130]